MCVCLLVFAEPSSLCYIKYKDKDAIISDKEDMN